MRTPLSLLCTGTLLLGLGVGCTTVVPLQTASTVPRGTWRTGGQIAVSPWCSVSRDVANQCAYLPEGLPLPELRLQGRTGVAEGTDVGASLLASAQLAPDPASTPLVRTGLYVDGKRELLSRELGDGRRQVLSIAPGVGLALTPVAPRWAMSPDLDVALPVFFGHQSQGWEWVVGAQVQERVRWRLTEADPERQVQARTEVGLSVGAFRRNPAGVAYQLGYVAPVDRLGGGRLTFVFGWVFDLKGP